MAFSPFARFRNFTLDNLKALLEVYPDQATTMSWNDAIDEIETVSHGYKRTAYQQACQLGLEDRGGERFRIQNYLYTFDDENLMKYLKFWIKTYFAPNPYVNSIDEPVLIYCELATELLQNKNHEVDFYDFFNRKIGGKSDDILLNVLKAYAEPLKYRKDNAHHIFYIESNMVEDLKKELIFIMEEFSVQDPKSKKEFFERYSHSRYCQFYRISNKLPEEQINNNDTMGNRKTGAENILLYGVPGAGKSHKIREKYCSDSQYTERIVFHPDYTYSDFVGQILPRVEGEKLKYIFTEGPFTKILKKAWEDPLHEYYLIIEEINRGNAPAIFGEIFQLLDRKDEDKYPKEEVGESEYGIVNYDIANVVYGDEEHEVKIPSNMYVLATMNTADQNVFTLDTAFQRRWNMEHIKNDVMAAEHADEKIEGTNVKWGAFATVINELVIDINVDVTSSEDKRLGAYFVNRKGLEVDKFPEKVLKYLWDDAFKMEKESVFNEKFKSLEKVIETYELTSDDKLKAVLKLDVYNKMLTKTLKDIEKSGVRNEKIVMNR